MTCLCFYFACKCFRQPTNLALNAPEKSSLGASNTYNYGPTQSLAQTQSKPRPLGRANNPASFYPQGILSNGRSAAPKIPAAHG